MKKFTKQYSLQKTLRFELKPVDETADYIEEYGSDYIKSIVKNDEKRSDDYQKVKKLIDDLHRDYISKKLESLADEKTENPIIAGENLSRAFEDYKIFKEKPSNKSLEEQWKKQQNELREKLAGVFSDKGDLFKKELITKRLPEFLKRNQQWKENKEPVESFKKFTTYFTGFHENRKNMYVKDDKDTSIANRAINENLPKFFENCIIFQDIRQKHKNLELSFTDKETLKVLGIQDFSRVFEPDFYLRLFSQDGIESYNNLLGGKTFENNIIDGLNKEINQYRQKENIHSRELPVFSKLHKQILAEITSHSFSYEPYTTDEQMLFEIRDLINRLSSSQGDFFKLKGIIEKIKNCDTGGVFLRGNAIDELSNCWLGNYRRIEWALDYFIEESGQFKNKKDKKNYKKRTKNQGYFSIEEIQSWMDFYLKNHDDDSEEKRIYDNAMKNNGRSLVDYFISKVNQPFKVKIKKDEIKSIDKMEKTVKPLLDLQELSGDRYPPKTNGENDKGGEGFYQIQKIQELLDSYINFLNQFRPLHLVYKRKSINISDPNQDLGFYNDFANLFDLMIEYVQSVYNKTRNHLSKKPFKTEKRKINFKNPNLMSGWDANKERNNSCVLFEKKGNYFLGIMHPDHRGLFDYVIGFDDFNKDQIIHKKEALSRKIKIESGGYRKMVYKLLPGPNKMLPKVFFSDRRRDCFNPPKEILEIRNKSSHTKNGNPQKGYKKAEFNTKDCHAMIDFFKDSIKKHPEWKEYNFQFSKTSECKDINDFYKEIETQSYRIEFHNIKDEYIDACIKAGKLFLFKIYNKDFSPRSKGTPNMHTLYWLGLFEDGNLQNTVLKLNGEAEMFFRKHSISKESRTIHRKNQEIQRKTNPDEGKSLFPYDIVKDRRYTQDKFFLHVPVTLNHGKSKKLLRFNHLVNKAVSRKTNVIGVDRGERHLLYFCIVDPQGKIIDQGSLNTISQGDRKTNYQDKLEQCQNLRDLARKSWTSIENIKELKQGYLSQVVHKLSQLIVEYEAIVCLEDLNSGFKQGRFKVEKQVYQKFEKVLIDKLNYLVDKKQKDSSKPGHYLNALQLTAPFESFEKLKKQSGILYYVGAGYTSKICPVTGFVNLLKTYYKSVEKSKDFFSKFKGIRFNPKAGYFEFDFDYKQTNPQWSLKSCRVEWRVCSHGERLFARKDDNGQWQPAEVIKPTDEIKAVFEDTGIDFKSGKDLREVICKQDSAGFFRKLMWGLQLTLQMRNSRSHSTNPEDDYLISPVIDENGNFYDSRQAMGKGLPENADANGAYHIALKGLWNIQKIINHDWSGERPRPPNFGLSNEEWFSFAQKKPFKNHG